MLADSDAPVPIPKLASTILASAEGMDASTWAGYGSFRRLLEFWSLAPLHVSWEGGVILDPQRHRAAPTPMPQPRVKLAEELAAITRLIQSEVAKTNQPVPCARIAQLITTQHSAIAADWNGLGAFRKFLESLGFGVLRVDWNGAGGRVYDPHRHTLSPAKAGKQNGNGLSAPDWGEDADLLPFATQIHDVTNAPLLCPADYRALFRVIEADLAERHFELNETGKRVRDRIRGSGHAVSRADVTWVLRGLLLRGHTFGKGEDDAQTLGRKTADNVRTLCLREQMLIDQATDHAIPRWIGGRD